MENPKIRFKGYTKDWEQRKLGELGTVQTCKRIFKERKGAGSLSEKTYKPQMPDLHLRCRR